MYQMDPLFWEELEQDASSFSGSISLLFTILLQKNYVCSDLLSNFPQFNFHWQNLSQSGYIHKKDVLYISATMVCYTNIQS